MRPQGVRPKFGGHGIHQPNASNRNSPRPQCSRSPCPITPQGNRTPNSNGRRFTPYGPNVPMMGPGMTPHGPMVGPCMTPNGGPVRPNGPMMGPGMTPNGAPIGPNVPMMGPNMHMMMPNRPTMGPNGPMSCTGFMHPSGPNRMRAAFGSPPPRGPPMLPNGSFPKNCNSRSPRQPTAKVEGVYTGSGDKHDENKSGQSNTTHNNRNYNYPHLGATPEMNCRWPVNTYPPAWNVGYPPNHAYYQNMDSQFSNQDFSQSYYNSYGQGYSQDYDENYDQYYNQGQTCMPNNYNNVKQEDFKPKLNQNGQKSKKNNEKFQKMRIHYCDTCDRSLPSEEALATHISEHKVCGLDDCKFTAHPRVVEKHQQMQHHTGLYRRIGSLYTPEDIEKWRKDRKKNYPTPKNVEERRAKQEEMFARGERMGTPNKRGPRNNFQKNGRFQQRPNLRPNHQIDDGNNPDLRNPPPNQPAQTPQPPRKWKPIFPPVAHVIDENEERSGVKPFPGTAALLPKKSDSSEEVDAPKPVQKDSLPSPLNNSLSFLCQYGDSSSEDDSDKEESQKDSTVSEKPVEENRPSESTIVETNSSHSERNVHPLQVEAETSVSLSVTLPQPSTSSEEPPIISERSIYVEEKIGNECIRTDTFQVPTQPQRDTETEDGEIQDSPTENAEQPEKMTNSISVEPSSHKTGSLPSRSSPSEKNPLTTETESKIVSADCFPKNCVLKEKSSEETEPCVSEKTTSNAFTPNEAVSLVQPDKEINNSKNGHNCSDDSGPEEVPIVKDGGDKEVEDEENDEVVGGGGGKKRRRQSRQPNKKSKSDEKQTNQQQQHNKSTQRHEERVVPRAHPPVRRAPTLLEKLLSKEICHERNVLLQCVRYVVENNFFRNERK